MTETIVRPKSKTQRRTQNQDDAKTRRQPPYHVVLLNDDDHTVAYVVELCQKVFGYPLEKGLKIADEVHNKKRCLLWTGALEIAEFKQQQIHALGRDPLVARCAGSMSAVVEPSA